MSKKKKKKMKRALAVAGAMAEHMEILMQAAKELASENDGLKDELAREREAWVDRWREEDRATGSRVGETDPTVTEGEGGMTKAKTRTRATEEQAKDDWEKEHGVRPKVIIGMDRGMPKAAAPGAGVQAGGAAAGAMLDEIRAAVRRAQKVAEDEAGEA